MPNSRVDCNLLFGSLALQMDFISRDELIAAIHAWVLDKQKSLGQILLDQGAVDAPSRALLDAVVQKHLELHSNDPQQSLAAVGLPAVVKRDLDQFADRDVQATLVHLVAHPSHEVGQQSTLPMQDAAVGDARFEILRSHASGGLGEVFVAQDREVNREVALKRLQERYAGNADSEARFLREAEITGRLEHPGIVPVYGLGTDGEGRPYYAMRFIRGQTLKQAIAQYHAATPRSESERRLELRQLLTRFIAVCNAIGYAHSRGVVHRDLKPSNIMLGKYGETLVVDWGLCKALGHREPAEEAGEKTLSLPAGSGSSETLPGSAVGTPSYMSPEQAEGRVDSTGPATDVYSLGATLYSILTGQEPFEATEIGDLLAKVGSGDFIPPRERNADVPPALNAICLKAMSLAPKNRYPSTAALASDLEHWLADEPVSAHPEPWPARTQRQIRRHRTLATGVSAAAVVAAVGLWIVLATRASAERRAAEGRRREADARIAEAESYERNGLIDSERGHRKDAVILLEKSRHTLAKLEATDRLQRERLARVTAELASLDRENGNLDHAFAMYREAIDTYADLIRLDPSSVETLHDLARIYGGRAQVYVNSGRFDEPLGDYERALDLEQKAIALDPREPSYILNLAALYNDRAIVHERRADLAKMEQDLQQGRKAIENARTLPALQPAALKDNAALDRSLRRVQAVLRQNLGNLLGRKGDLKRALAEFSAARQLAEGLAADEPGTVEYEIIATRCGVQAGFISLQRGDLQQAIALLGKSLERLRNMSRRFPGDDDIRFLLAHCLSNHAAASIVSIDYLPPTGQPEAIRQVEKYVDEANGILTSMQNDRKDADQIALLRVANYIGRGMVRYKRQEWTQALPWFDQGIEYCQLQERAGHSGPEMQSRGVLLQSIRALTYYHLDRFAEALVDTEAILRKGDPGGLALLRAAILAKTGKHHEGTAEADKLLAEQKPPANPEFVFDVANVYSVALEGVQKDKALSEKQKADTAHEYAAKSVNLMRQAFKAGYSKFDKIRDAGPNREHDLDPIRNRDEFKQFLGELPAAKTTP